MVAFEFVTALVLALLIAWATYSSAEASGPWQSATRQEASWSVAAVEVVRHVYQDQAPLAFQLSLAESRLQALLHTGGAGQGVAERNAANETLRTAAGEESAVNKRYKMASGGYDLAARLADVRNANPDLTTRTVAQELAAGDRMQERARLLSLAAVAVLTLFVVITVLRRRVSHRPPPNQSDGEEGVNTRKDPGSSTTAQDGQVIERSFTAGSPTAPNGRGTQVPPDSVDVIVEPFTSGDGQHRGAAWLAFSAWVLLVVAPLLQVEMSARAAREDATATRLVSEIARNVLASQLHAGVSDQAQYAAIFATSEIVGRGLVTDDDLVTATAELDAVSRWERVVAAQMSRAPTTADGIDADLISAIRSTASDQDALRRMQNDAFDKAADLGEAVRWLTFCVALAAFAATAASLAHREGRPGAAARLCTVALVVGSLVTLLTGLGTAAT